MFIRLDFQSIRMIEIMGVCERLQALEQENSQAYEALVNECWQGKPAGVHHSKAREYALVQEQGTIFPGIRRIIQTNRTLIEDTIFVTLRDGTQVPRHRVQSTLKALQQLGNKNFESFFHFVEFSCDSKYDHQSLANSKKRARKYQLITDDPVVDEQILRITRCATHLAMGPERFRQELSLGNPTLFGE